MSKNSAQQKEPFNVICIKWGTIYSADYVNKLFSMVTRNSTFNLNFYCFTDDVDGLDSRIICKPLPRLAVSPEDDKYAYKKEAGLCDDDLGGLRGQRVLYFDLDVVLVANIDDFFTYPEGEDFVIVNDWNTRGNSVGQASCYSWVVGTLGVIKKYFEEHPKEVVAEYFTASQEYLSAQVIKHKGEMKFWPEQWCRSFRFHCMPIGILRSFITPRIPAGTRVVVFHGRPNPHEAREGKWSNDFSVPFYKRWYKTLRPTTWIDDYWK